MHLKQAEALFGSNFIGPDRINSMLTAMGCSPLRPEDIPPLEYSDTLLEKSAADFLLVLGYPGTAGDSVDILKFRDCFGIDPDRSEPCLYNQDWYLKEDFVHKTLDSRWYLLRKDVFEDTRSLSPESIAGSGIVFPSAILCVYAFFAFYLACGQPLWRHDFVWCSDTDHNGDRIYVGKYHDIDGVNKNGFSIHRHLALRPCYSSITTL